MFLIWRLNNVTDLFAMKQSFMKARNSNLEGLLQMHVEMVAKINNLNTDLQMLSTKIITSLSVQQIL